MKKNFILFNIDLHLITLLYSKINIYCKYKMKKGLLFMEVYSAQEVAEMLKVNIRTVYNEIERGNLKAKKVGHQYRIMKKDLEAYMENDK